jgi:hypothetical protein
MLSLEDLLPRQVLLRAPARPLTLRFKAGLAGVPSAPAAGAPADEPRASAAGMSAAPQLGKVSATFTTIGPLGLRFRPLDMAAQRGVQLVEVRASKPCLC